MTAPIPAPGANKAELRRWAKAQRAAPEMAAISAALVARIRGLPEFQDAVHLLLYHPLPGELNLLALALDPAKRFYLPRCAAARRLAIHPFVPGETLLVAGQFGLHEPDPAQVPEVDPALLDLVLVPALLLSRRGERLGYGAGYYDRFLPSLRLECRTIGALPSALLVDALPSDPWDIPLDLVVTETEIFRRVG